MDSDWGVKLLAGAKLAALCALGTAVYFTWIRYWPLFQQHVVLRVRHEFRRLTSRLTARVVAPTYSVLPGVVMGLPPNRRLSDLCISRWARAFLTDIPMRVLPVAALVVAVWNEAVIRREWARKGPAPQTSDPLKAWIGGCVDAVRWAIFVLPSELSAMAARVWGHPTEAVGLFRPLIVAVLLCGVILLVLPGLLVLVGLGPLLPRTNRRRIDAESESRNWPVVLLMLSAVHCGRAVERLRTHGPIDLPQVSVRRAERVIRRAWKTRHAKVRRHQQLVLKAHAARVVSALRLAEARQYENPEEALRIMATLLATIAHRYAEGRTLQLLDEHQMRGAEPIADRAWLRLAVSGLLIVGVLIALSWAGIPEMAAGPVVALIITVVFAAVYRGRIPGYHDLIDIFRGADRG